MSCDQLEEYQFDDDDNEKNWINDLNKKRKRSSPLLVT